MKRIILILLALLILANTQTYSISSTLCAPCTLNGVPCSQCVYISGGPFYNYYCVTGQPVSSNLCGFGVDFTCSSSSCGGSMSYSVTANSISTGESGCAVSSNQDWQGVQQTLNSVYSELVVGFPTSYNWNTECVLDNIGVSVISGAIIAIIVVSVVVFIVIVLIIVCCCLRRRKAAAAAAALAMTTTRNQ